MIFYFSVVQVHFDFCLMNFIVLFPFLINDYHIMFIIIIFCPSGISGWVICVIYLSNSSAASWRSLASSWRSVASSWRSVFVA